jgi:hypothetical protein
MGTKGRIVVDDPWKNGSGHKIRRYEGWDTVAEELDFGISNAALYAAEADAVAQYLEAGECPHVTIEDTLQQMRTLDKLRASGGVVFGAELKA